MELFRRPKGAETRWFSPENPSGAPGAGGASNQGAKGRPYVRVPAGETNVLAEIEGPGRITRIWATINDRSPEMLTGLRIRMTWDGAETPAVDCPWGDFFGVALGRTAVFESELFSNPEGRSFCCFVPMPFRSAAKIEVVNLSGQDLSYLFYDVNAVAGTDPGEDALYFHAISRSESPNELGEEYVLLPKTSGSGRFLGVNVGVTTHPAYEDTWWGEGEVKVRIGEEVLPTLCGTGTEDYIGTAWGQGHFTNRTQGCPIADSENRQWAFYRYHTVDPIYFDGAISVAIQTIGGASSPQVQTLQAAGVPLIPTTLDSATRTMEPIMNRESPANLAELDIQDTWCNFWRQDSWSSTAYFYLDRPAR